MQSYKKQTLQACLKVSVFMTLYGEKPSIRKRKAPEGRFCECGSESKEEPKVPGKRKAPKGRFCEWGSESKEEPKVPKVPGKRKAPKRRFCERGSESKEEPKVPGKRKAPKRRFCEWGSESLIIYLKSGGYYEQSITGRP